MTVEHFTSEQFEEAISHLPFESLGVINNEYSYRIPLDGQSALLIRSSVKANNLSAGTSKDSIRVWLVDRNDKPLAAKTFRWVTRQPGWQDRLNERMSEITRARVLAGDCEKCHKPKGIYKTKQGKNRGKMFVKCFDCDSGFQWMDDIKPGEAYFSEGSHGKTINSSDVRREQVAPLDRLDTKQRKSDCRFQVHSLPASSSESNCGGRDKRTSHASDMSRMPTEIDNESSSEVQGTERQSISYPKSNNRQSEPDTLPEETRDSESNQDGSDGQSTEKSDLPSVSDNGSGLADFLAELEKDEPQSNGGFKPSHYQEAIYDFVENDNRHGIVDGVAGCGKTTTNVQSLELLNPNLKIKYAAFNKHIEQDISAKAPNHVDVSTFHKWGLTNIRAVEPKTRIHQYKVYDIIDDLRLADNYTLKATITKLVSLLKSSLLEPTDNNIQLLADDFCLDIEPHELNKVRRAFNASIHDMQKVDFDDMVYFPAAGLVPCKPYDFIAVDEAQDMNSAQMALATNSLNGNSRMLIIGDPFQSIYAFRGAYVGIMDTMANELEATRLPLSISYRAPLAIVDLVNRKYPHITFEAAPDAIPGRVSYIDYEQFYDVVEDSHGVICRTNAPLVKPCFALIRRGIKATILGRNIGKGLLSLIKKRERLVKVTDLDELLASLETYRKNEVRKFEAANKVSRAALLDDQCQTIYALADECYTIEELKDKCQATFSDERQGIVFSTVHKAKGLEWDTAHILEPQLMPHPMAQTERDRKQEMNIAYVADTRTKRDLFYVRG